MVALAAEEEASAAAGSGAAAPSRVAGTGGPGAGGAGRLRRRLAFLADPNEQLLRDLPLLESLDYYQKIDDAEFLRKLQAEKLFAKEAADGS